MKKSFSTVLFLALVLSSFTYVNGLEPDTSKKSDPKISNRPVVPGVYSFEARYREKNQEGKIISKNKVLKWKASETIIIICDMWDGHFCKAAAHRVGVMAPYMNKVITRARSRGVMIIHSPSGCMDVYAKTPYRLRMIQAKQSKPPFPLNKWCHLEPDNEPPMPVDTSNCSCDDPVVGPAVRQFSKQNDKIVITGYDGISDSGQEVYNYCQEHGIKNVVLMGVHTNMCVLGRPFGIRQMVNLKMNVVLCRDLTDSMYDPREYPYVSHTRGTELVVEHIEQYWCPTIEGKQLLNVIPGSDNPLPKTKRPTESVSK